MRIPLSFEPLEPRWPLAADAGFWGVNHRLAAEAASARVSLSARAVQVSDPGATFATALDLGSLSGTKSLTGSIGGRDTADVVRFALAAPSKVDIALGGLRADIDVTLYNNQGQGLALSNNAGAASESISKTLASGVYYVAVTPWRTASSSYLLTVAATTTQTTAPTTPPTTPASPNAPVASFPNVAYYGGANEWNLNSINAPEAWANGYQGAGVVVAVVDTGVSMSHPDLASQIWVNSGEVAGNGVDDDHNGYVDDVHGWDFVGRDNDPSDGNGHGTHVAGIVAANDDGRGSTGVAPNAKIMPVRVLGNDGSGSDAAVAAGIRYAAQNGADIINLSLGGSFSSVIQSAIQYAQQRDVLVVTAAGNESASTPSYPGRFSAAMTNVISVGAYSSSNAIAGFSNRVGGSGSVQVDAPGVGVYSTYPGGQYASFSGTSMASPHVAGLAALALSANSNLMASQLRQLIVAGANRAISGSDSRGGVNAAATVALAAAGRTTTSASVAATTQTSATSNSAALHDLALIALVTSPSRSRER